MNLPDLIYNQYFLAFNAWGVGNTPTQLRITEDNVTRIIEDGQDRETE